MSVLWQKNSTNIDEQLQDFMAGEDVLLDQVLLPFDILASIAHVNGLKNIQVLSEVEASQIITELNALAQEFDEDEFLLDNRFEDGHSAIEFYLTEKLGDVGKKVHTGRSRNDQVLVASRLYMRHRLEEIFDVCGEIIQSFLNAAHAGEKVAMPGYTHLQRAVPSSVGMWAASFAESFLDNALGLMQCFDIINCSPLGTAAGYGVNLPLDREHVAEALDFDRLQVNPMYAQNSRGKFELQALNALSFCLMDVRRLSWDLSLFTTAEYDFVTLPNTYTTGSSIMPNKRNPDVVELLRAAVSPLLGATNEIASLLSLPSGYQRDLQGTKGPFIRNMESGLKALRLIPALVDNLEWDKEKMTAAISADMYATDRAVELTSSGVPFRDAYRQVGDELEQLEKRDPQQSLADRVSLGGPGNLGLDILQNRYKELFG